MNNTLIDKADDLHIVVPMYNILEYSDNYSLVTSGRVWNYYRDEMNGDANKNENDYRVNTKKTTTSKSFDYKTKIIGSTPANKNRLYREVENE